MIECDELSSFVGVLDKAAPSGPARNKQNKQWVWLALDRTTREIVRFAQTSYSVASWVQEQKPEPKDFGIVYSLVT